MDSNSRPIADQSTSSPERESENDSAHQFDHPDAHCIFCRRSFLLDAETSDGFEAIYICRDCKLVVLDDHESDINPRETSTRTQRQGTSGSSESVEDMFSQQFTELIGLVRHNHETHQRAAHSSLQNRSRRLHRALSDSSSEYLENADYLVGENDSTISFANWDESDASVDGTSLLDRLNFTGQDYESHLSSDTDIDPMHTGHDQWSSSDDEDDEEWEEADPNEEASVLNRHTAHDSNSPTGSSGRDAQNDGWLFWRARNHGSLQNSDLLNNDMEESELPRYFGNSGDYLDARGFEALLEQLAETESLRRGAPPAAASFIRNLPRVVISKDHEKNGTSTCAVCKDPLLVGTETNKLPCSHYYHPSCILPWLNTRNSCPVCRYELPTDDPDYEAGKRIIGSRRELYEVQEQYVVEESSLTESQEDIVDTESRENYISNGQLRGGWSYLAPIVSIVGMVLVLWLGTPLAEASSHHSFQQDAPQDLGRSNSAQVNQDNRSRRWWFF